ncbi:MAG: lysophospholipid acyltransferase family protein [Planctomycetota bacterium]|jgi:1-acyl-sn-glycerol-3-phosphate acyltransferase|nr:lysophospholipid acyltransferase family protein [Planctomycetota bacterium]MDP6763429.1 lysophospholipid acyltransferase family protein [Planctomycetota bacterium]
MESTSDQTARRPGPLRGFLLLLPVACFVLVGAAGLALFALLTPGSTAHRSLPLIHLWGRVPLWAFGVRLEVHGAERLDEPGAHIVLFNHVSLLDMFVLASICPHHPVGLYKAELGRVPGLGWAFRALGMVPVDRRNHEKALASVAELKRRMDAEHSTVILAPEGTRSRRGGLQQFKLGSFHLAAQTGAPVVPLIMRGIPDVLPMGSFLVRSGTVRLDFLEPIDTSDWSAERVREHAADVREVFLRYLEPAP